MNTRTLLMLACGCAFFSSCSRSGDSPGTQSPGNQTAPVVTSWIVGKWIAENETSLEFKSNGTFEQVYSETQLEAGQVIYDEESAKKARFTKEKVTTVGNYRLIDEETMEVERQGIPAYRIKLRRDKDELLLIGDGGEQDRLHRVSQ